MRTIDYNGAKQASYQYNAVSELVEMDDWTGTNTFEVDFLGRLKKDSSLGSVKNEGKDNY